HEYRRISAAGDDVFIRRLLDHPGELLGIFDGSEFRDIERTVRRQLRTEEIVEADVRDDGAIIVRIARKCETHEEPAGAAAFDADVPRVTETVSAQPLGARSKVVAALRLRCEVRGESPTLAVFPASTHVRLREHAST